MRLQPRKPGLDEKLCPGLRKKQHGQQVRGGDSPLLLCPHEAPPAVLHPVQGQVGWGFEQPDLVKDVPAHGRGVGLDDI